MRRLLSALFALWFAVVLGDPGMLHSCAMHGAGHGAHGAVAEAGAAHEMAGMAHHAPADSGPERTPVCTCVGHCCATTATALVGPTPTVEFAGLVAPVAAPAAAPSAELPRAPEHSLPFANGPPAA